MLLSDFHDRASPQKSLLIRALRVFRRKGSLRKMYSYSNISSPDSNHNANANHQAYKLTPSSYKHPQYHITTKRHSVEYVPINISTLTPQHDQGYAALNCMLGQDRYKIHTPMVENCRGYYGSYEVRKQEILKNKGFSAMLRKQRNYDINRYSVSSTIKGSQEPSKDKIFMSLKKVKPNCKIYGSPKSRKDYRSETLKSRCVFINKRKESKLNIVLGCLNYDNMLPMLGRDHKEDKSIEVITGW